MARRWARWYKQAMPVDGETAIPRHWTIRHFSQANPAGPGQGDVRALLARVGATLEKLGPVEVQDVTFHTEITADGPWHSMTVY
jgi:hypothetical protein